MGDGFAAGALLVYEKAMITTKLRSVSASLALALVVCACSTPPGGTDVPAPEPEPAMFVHFLEIVTHEVDATCAALEELHGVAFSAPVAAFGNGRTAKLENGGRMSVRAPMHSAEEPAVRPYILVDDVEAAAQVATAAGGQLAVPPMEIPGEGRFALYFQGDNQFGLWER